MALFALANTRKAGARRTRLGYVCLEAILVGDVGYAALSDKVKALGLALSDVLIVDAPSIDEALRNPQQYALG